jgi:Zn ribbon nucleic-acid-binding protein
MKEKTKAVTERLAKTNINSIEKLADMKNKLKLKENDNISIREPIEKGLKEKSNSKQVKNTAVNKDEVSDDIRSKSVDTLNANNSDLNKNKRLNSPNRNQNSDKKKKNIDTTEQTRGISLDEKTNTLAKNKQTSSQPNLLASKNKKVIDEKTKLGITKKDKENDKGQKLIDDL